MIKYDLKKMMSSEEDVYSQLPEVHKTLELIEKFEKGDFDKSISPAEVIYITSGTQFYIQVILMIVKTAEEKVKKIVFEIVTEIEDHTVKILSNQEDFENRNEENIDYGENIDELTKNYNELENMLRILWNDLLVISPILITSIEEISAEKRILSKKFSKEITSLLKPFEDLRAMCDLLNAKMNALKKYLVPHRNIGVKVDKLEKLLDSF